MKKHTMRLLPLSIVLFSSNRLRLMTGWRTALFEASIG